MNLPTPGVPLPVTPITNPISETVASIQTWGTVVVVCLIIIAVSCALMAALLVHETYRSKKPHAVRPFND